MVALGRGFSGAIHFSRARFFFLLFHLLLLHFLFIPQIPPKVIFKVDLFG
jgi:hypothetical protein